MPNITPIPTAENNMLHGQSLTQLRFNLIEQQIRPCNVLNPAVLNTLYQVHRETFVPQAHQMLAFAEIRLPLSSSASMLTPILEGRILQVLDIQKHNMVLVVGTGSGYLSACVANLAHSVVGLEIDANLNQAASDQFVAHKIDNITSFNASLDDYLQGNPDQNFDIIVLTGSVKTLPEHLMAHLNDQGRIFAVVGDLPAMHACVFHKLADTVKKEDLFETQLERLIGYEDAPIFEF